MQRSEQIGELVTALAKAQNQFTTVPKKKTGHIKGQTKAGREYDFTYQYADLADCLSMALPVLSANGVALSQPHILVDGKLRVVTLLLHSSGQWMQSDGIEISEEGDPQQFGAESTYFRRYDGCSFIGIAPDEDTDAQQAGDRQKRDPKPAEVRASAEKRAEEMQKRSPEEGQFELVGDVLKCVIKGATQKKTAGEHPKEYLNVVWNGRLQGFNYATTFDTALFDIIMGCVNQNVELKLRPWKTGDKFLNIVGVVSIDGVAVDDPHQEQIAS